MSIHTLIIPAAGLGTRMRPVNPHLPKELLPLAGKPAIQYAVEEGLNIGVENIVIVISPQKEMFKERLSGYRNRIHFVYQNAPQGEADAIALAEPFAQGHDIGIIYPDNLYLPAPGGLRHLQAAYEKTHKDVLAVSPVNRYNVSALGNSGRVDLLHEGADIYQILRFHPKAPGAFQLRFSTELRTCGMMITGAHLFDFIRRARNYVQRGEFTDEPVRQLLLKERGLLGVRLPGTVHDIGNPQGYALCNQLLSS